MWKNGRALRGGSDYGLIGFHVQDMDDAYAHALAAGSTPVRPPSTYGSIRSGFVADCDGHEIELVAG